MPLVEKFSMGKKKKDKFDINEIYPNSPLVEVVCEVRFQAELDIECRRNEFYNRIRVKYPLLMIPAVQPGKAMQVQPYRFENQNRDAGIMLAIDKYSFYIRKYKGHKSFIKEFNRITAILCNIYPLQKILRIGWRYINIIPFARENGFVPLQRFLSIGLKVPDGVSENFENLSIVFISRVSNGSITTKIETVLREENQQEALLLDFDFGMTHNLSFSKLNAHVNAAHKQARQLFEELITKEYREYLRGDTV